MSASASAAPSVDALSGVFVRLGLDSKTADATARSAKVGPALLQVARDAGVEEAGCEKAVGVLLLHFATKGLTQANAVHFAHRQDVLDAIARSRSIRSVPQVDAACEYLKKGAGGQGGEYRKADLERQSGVGVSYSDTEVDAVVGQVLDGAAAVLAGERYRAVSKLLGQVTGRLQWADGRRVKERFDAEVERRLGPKTEADMQPTAGKGAKQAQANSLHGPATANGVAATSTPSLPSASASSPNGTADSSGDGGAAPASALSSPSPSFLSLPSSVLQSPSALSSFLEDIDGREIVAARNTPEQRAAHEAVVPPGQVRTRFPPEPNGHLHLGHCKAMNFNFGLARASHGSCFLRFDDTNPEAEKLDYITQIVENVQWLGHDPAAITYSSDYFPQLYDLAVQLIRSGHAYVDHQTAAEIKASRDQKAAVKLASPWRQRPVEESLRLFDAMRKGKFDEGAATLRMKGDLNHPNPQMWDLVAYRIKCIYPSYDYTHCIVDSLENITHSCCTLEFEVRRESYYWLLDVLGLYKPKVWEYSRLNVEYNVMSKRRLLRLVEEGHVTGWDDPRLLTLNGLRRRGYSPSALRDFCNTVGISRNETMIPMQQLEHWCRNDLESKARRAMVVQRPVRVELSNYPAQRVEQVQAPDFPKAPQLGSHPLPFSRVLFIDQDDVRLQDDDKDFFGLAPGKEVHLKYAYNITCTHIHMDNEQPTRIARIEATVDLQNTHKPKGKIHWVAEPRPGQPPLQVSLRLYDRLFLSRDPMDPSIIDWLSDLNHDSLRTIDDALADPSLLTARPGDCFQFERLAFFVTDPDSRTSSSAEATDDPLPPRLVFNRTVTLRESKPKDVSRIQQPRKLKADSKAAAPSQTLTAATT